MGDEFKHVILQYLPVKKILDAYRAAPGNELDEKFASPDSSSALVANTFGFFLDVAEKFPQIPGLEDVAWPPQKIGLEKCLRFPWRGGHHPWLDVVIETQSHLIGVESKRYEPFRGGHFAEFSEAYNREVWGAKMGAFEALRDKLRKEPDLFRCLDAAQLVKHALAIRNEANKKKKQGILLYLYAEPTAWPDGRLIDDTARRLHAEEIETIRARTKGAEVRFTTCRYRQLLAAMKSSLKPDVQSHAFKVQSKYSFL